MGWNNKVSLTYLPTCGLRAKLCIQTIPLVYSRILREREGSYTVEVAALVGYALVSLFEVCESLGWLMLFFGRNGWRCSLLRVLGIGMKGRRSLGFTCVKGGCGWEDGWIFPDRINCRSRDGGV